MRVPQELEGSPEWAFMDMRSAYSTYVLNAPGTPETPVGWAGRRAETQGSVMAAPFEGMPVCEPDVRFRIEKKSSGDIVKVRELSLRLPRER